MADVSRSASRQYADAFRGLVTSESFAPATVIDEPDVIAALASSGRLRALVLGDSALTTLDTLITAASAGAVSVLGEAPQVSARLMANHPPVPSRPQLAMVRADLHDIPELELDSGLEVRRVAVNGPDSAAVALDAVTAFAVTADPEGGDDGAEHLARSLREITPAPTLLAAVDHGGQVRASSGWGLSASDARILMVNTHHAWRRRGVGATMTALALTGARRAGATRAWLDATVAGAPVYRRLGFVSAGAIVRFAITAA